jgi:predicted AAA+ superfamily ATPase
VVYNGRVLERLIQHPVQQDLLKKIVFISGPRQCGKTTLAQELIRTSKDSGLYLNWDDPKDRLRIIRRDWDDSQRLIVLDEIHKNKKWKNFVKGTYDTQKTKHSFLVTGSARLDLYRKGQDSLMGRYHHWRLHPMGLDEHPQSMSPKEALRRLLRVGGFPEPFLDGGETVARRWRLARRENIFRSDIQSIQNVGEITKLELCFDLLRSRVGSPISYKSLHEDLDVSAPTVKAWTELLSLSYASFIVRPYAKMERSIKKAPKIYFFDNADVDGDEGAVFENLVANHLLKKINYLQDKTGHAYDLCYLRDKEGHEVDFVILKDRKPLELIEAKLSDTNDYKNLQYYAERLKPERAVLLVAQPNRSLWKRGRMECLSVFDYFAPGKAAAA